MEIVETISYEAVTTLYEFGPTEAPMFVFSNLRRLDLLLACMLGKGLAAYAVLLLGKTMEPAWLLKRLSSLESSRIAVGARETFRQWPMTAFFLCQAVPMWGPMHISLYAAAVMRGDPTRYTLLACLGTAVRNTTIFLVFSYIHHAIIH